MNAVKPFCLHRLRCLALVATAVAVLTACSKANPASTPSGSQLLQQASQAMGQVNSAHIELTLAGYAPYISSAQADISKDGKAQGSVVIAGVQFPFRLLGKTFYIKPPTGGWVSSPPPYDPTQLLDPGSGLPSLLSKATDGKTLGSESVGGTSAYKVSATIPTDLISTLADLAPGQNTLPATAWIATDNSRLLKFYVSYRTMNGDTPADQSTQLTGLLTKFGETVDVTAPI